MKRAHLCLAILLVVGCVTNPYTGKSQLILFDRDFEMKLGLEAYHETLGKERVTFDPAYLDPVAEVTGRLSGTLEMGWDNIPPPKYDWQVCVIDNPEVLNAWCLPGGKMAVYTGILPILQDQNGLAVVMGHEIFHAVLRHGMERISEGLVTQAGLLVASGVLGEGDPEKTGQIYAALGIVTTVGVALPHSRGHETEADQFGLYLAAKAGYDPRAGVGVWERMRDASGGGGIEFLSTHPNPESRIENMKQWMPKALEYYEASQKQQVRRLPPIGGGVGPRWTPPPSGMSFAGLTAGHTRSKEVEGKQRLSFEFELQQTVLIEKIVLVDPEGDQVVMEPKTTVFSGEKWAFTYTQANASDPPLPTGIYRATFIGKNAGVDFQETREWVVQ